MDTNDVRTPAALQLAAELLSKEPAHPLLPLPTPEQVARLLADAAAFGGGGHARAAGFEEEA